jgi:hypothetical protein
MTIHEMTIQYDNQCRKKFYELLDGYTRVSGYSPSQVVSVMTVLGCDAQEAMYLLDNLYKYDDIDWSEATWYEMWTTFTSLKEILDEKVAERQ